MWGGGAQHYDLLILRCGYGPGDEYARGEVGGAEKEAFDEDGGVIVNYYDFMWPNLPR